MYASLKTKIGPFLVISSVLAVWTLLAAQPVLAQSPVLPSCRSSSQFVADNTVEKQESQRFPIRVAYSYDSTLTDGFSFAPPSANEDDYAITQTDGRPDANPAVAATYHRAIFQIVVPQNTAGDLTANVAAGQSNVSGAALCRGGTRVDGFGYTIERMTGAADTYTAPTLRPLMAKQVSPNQTYYVVVESQTVYDSDQRDGNNNLEARNSITEISPQNLTVTFVGVMPNEANPSSDGDIGEGDIIRHVYYVVGTDTVGLLTARTTGSTDTTGTLLDGTTAIATAKDGGSGDNFQMDVPVDEGAYTIEVSGGDEFETGLYDLVVDFKVASAVGTVTAGTPGTPATATTVAGDIESSSDDDYFWFLVGENQKGHLTVQTTGNTRTRGTLYWPSSERQTDDVPSATNFEVNVPVYVDGTEPWKRRYIVLVEGRGSTGDYMLAVTLEGAASTARPASAGDMVGFSNQDIDTRGETLYYVIDVTKAGTLSVESRNPTDDTADILNTRGFLEGADGQLIAQNSAIGSDNDHFRIIQSVMPGRYIVRVKGQTDNDTGEYDLVTSFIEAEVASTRPPDPVDPPECPETEMLPVDARGVLENPSGDGFRSGIGVISGWVCSANEVEIVITSNDRQGSSPVNLNAAYGTSRPDTVGACRGHNDPNTGFGMTYNFNHLREGEYTIRAFADGDELIGAAQTFNVVHLTTFELDDEDRFLRDEDLLGTECRVDGFPELGESTILEWEQSTQNFVIIDAGPVSQ